MQLSYLRLIGNECKYTNTAVTYDLIACTDLYNDMILSTFSISALGFALDLPKRPRTNRDNIP